MKKFYYYLLSSFLLISVSVSAQQRNCYSHEYLQEKLQEDPSYRSKLDQLEVLTKQRANNTDLQRNNGNILYVPVVVHVVWNSANPQENISDAQVESQIDVIYRDFRGLNDEWQNIKDNIWPQAADMEIEFYMAQIDPDGNPTNGITRKETNVAAWGTNDDIKFSSQGGVDAWDPTRYFNFWVGNIGSGILGYATFPASAGDPDDGIVMSPEFFGSSDYEAAAGETFFLSPPYDKGRTTTHEIGHYLNLRHIWGDGGCGVDDFVSDTPESDGSNFGCATGSVSCGSVDMVENYMDYSDDSCMGLFTEEQKNRMRAVLEPGGPRDVLEQPPFPFLISVNEDSQDLNVCTTDTAILNLAYTLNDPAYTGTATFSASGLPAGATATFNPTSADADNTPVTLTIGNLGGAAVDSYTILIEATDGSDTAPTNTSLNVYNTTFSTLAVVNPTDSEVDVNPTTMFEWSEDVNAASYEIDIATDAGFTNIIAGGVTEDAEFEAMLLNTTDYFWRVRSVNDCANGTYTTASFTTGNIQCANIDSTDTPLDIPDGAGFFGPENGPPAISSSVVTDAISITDVNVTVNIPHTFVSDLTLILTSPSGTEIELVNGVGGNGDNFTNTIFDSDSATPIADGAPPFTGTFAPSDDLSILVGEVSGGTWTLTAFDAFSADTGTINSWSLEICGVPLPDADGDGIGDPIDNCPDVANTDQADLDSDGLGDVCDDDVDGDGVLDVNDNCPLTANPDQADLDNNGIGEACDLICANGTAEDTPFPIPETLPNGDPFVVISEINIEDNFEISDINVTIDISHTFTGDLRIVLIEPTGNDFILLSEQNGGGSDDFSGTVFDDEAPTPIGAGTGPFTGSFIPDEPLATFNGRDSQGTWSLGVVDFFNGDGGALNSWSIEICGFRFADDFDGDGVTNDLDNCLFTVNSDQADNDGDGTGDLCDDDDDNDGVLDINDNCQFTANSDQADNDMDGLGDVCDDDDDNDGVLDVDDNCQFIANADQSDLNENLIGDVCEGLIANDILTPNGDGINDTWTVINTGRFPNAIFKVYNRWGNEVFSAKGYNNDWRGTYSGKTLPTGSYYYQIDQNGDGTTILSGWIYITL